MQSLCSHTNPLHLLAHHPSLLRMATAILLRCTRTMIFSAPALIELLVELADDDVEDVARAAVSTLADYSRAVSPRCSSSGGGNDVGGGGDPHGVGDNDDADLGTVAMLCEENLLSLLAELPRLTRSASDEELVRATALLASYTALLGSRIGTVFTQPRNVRRLTTAAV
jgi:hypothetical protein